MRPQQRNRAQRRRERPTHWRHKASNRRSQRHRLYFSRQPRKQLPQLLLRHLPDIRILRIVVLEVIPQQRATGTLIPSRLIATRNVDEKLTAFRFLKDNDNDSNLFNTESGVLVHVSSHRRYFEHTASRNFLAKIR